MDDQTQSPAPQPSKPSLPASRFDLHTAFNYLVEGRKITRESWENPELYYLLTGEKLALHLHDVDGLDHPAILVQADITATDWLVL